MGLGTTSPRMEQTMDMQHMGWNDAAEDGTGADGERDDGHKLVSDHNVPLDDPATVEPGDWVDVELGTGTVNEGVVEDGSREGAGREYSSRREL